MNTRLTNLKSFKNSRKNLRNHSTEAEAVLWRYLKNRQFSVDHYILDFYCPEENLCIELDGQHHFTEEGNIHDVKRDAYLKKLGITTIRFENSGVWNNLEGMLYEIKNHFKK